MLKRIQMPMIASRCNATGIMDTVLQTVSNQERACGLIVVKTTTTVRQLADHSVFSGICCQQTQLAQSDCKLS